ncbi:MAG: hypothetical protein ABI616_08020 [Pseudomonadota bacterium]
MISKATAAWLITIPLPLSTLHPREYRVPGEESLASPVSGNTAARHEHRVVTHFPKLMEASFTVLPLSRA